MRLYEAIDPQLPARIAIVGGGGKTTTLFQLARQLPGKVWVSTTTHLGTDQLTETDKHFIVREVTEESINDWLQQKTTLLTGDFTEDDRVKGPSPEVMAKIKMAADERGISLLIEADGSKSRPLKAPGENEPATPAWAETVITIVGSSVLGKKFDDSTVHRVDPYIKITSSRLGDEITLDNVIQVLSSPLGGLKNSPVTAQKIALFNQADTTEMRKRIGERAPELLAAGYDRVVIGGLKKAPDELDCYSRD
jgi:probable selenium-dependent hydroxylase accessory protein YqeC